ncbi:MAG: hypothetical protein U9Q17_01015 [Chloroflexota bacterium]|nr:hypothetical protein [Chloroflexota bacterium]
MVDKPQDESIKDKIIALLEKGYKRDQLINDLGFKERTVDAAIRAYKKLNKGNEGSEQGGKLIAEDETPASPSKSRGKGAAGNGGRDGALAIRKDKESVLPEWLETDVAQIFNGELQDQRIFLAGMSVPLMGLRLFAEGVKPIIDLMATWQKGQAEAAEAAQQSGTEIAETAGETAAAGVAKFLMETKPWQAASPNPMAAMVTQAIQPYFSQVIGRMFGMFSGIGQPPGTIPNQPGQPTQQNPPQGGTPVSTPGTEQVSEQEIKEVFGDE